MPLSVFFQPIALDEIVPSKGYSTAQLGSLIKKHIKEDGFPDLSEGNKPHIALLGVEEDRGAIDNQGCAKASNAVRKQLYALYSGQNEPQMVDLGNIAAGETIRDTYVAIQKTCEELIKADILPIIIGGGQDLTFAQYTAYEHLERKVEATIVDHQFDLDQHNSENAPLNSRTYLNHIILYEPDYLFNINQIGYQRYFVSRQSVDLYEQLFFNAVRLREFSDKAEHIEPLVRSADMLSFDISAIRASDAPGNANATPNGLFGQDACRLCRYAGMSDKLSSVGFYEYNPSFDVRNQTAMLIAQMIWYLLDGYYARKNDMPFVPKSAYITYRATLEHEAYEIVFVKSKKTDRWWMQVPYFGSKSINERYYMVPCSYADYQTALSGEMPDLWWRTHQKLQ